MSRDFRPKPGCRAIGTWPDDQPPPDGWVRGNDAFPIVVARVLDGTPPDTAVEIIGYTESADCGVSSAARAKGRIAAGGRT